MADIKDTRDAEFESINPDKVFYENGNGVHKEGYEDETGKETVFHALDNAPISWYHIKAVLIAGMGFFTDAYDLFSIGLLVKLIGNIYYQGAMPLSRQSALTGVALCGTLCGQIVFGLLGDRFGRKAVYGVTLWLMIVSSICSSLSFGRSPDAVVSTLCFFRFWLGVGVGGDYPLSATIMSEYSSRSKRGSFIAAVFAMQGTGILTAAIVTLITSSIFKNYYNLNPMNADYVWRVVLAFAAVPTAATLYMRSKMPETARFTALIKGDTAKAQQDMNGVLGESLATDNYVRDDRNWKMFLTMYGSKLLGCCMTWLLLDIAFYSQGLFQSDIFKAVGWVPDIPQYWLATDQQFLPPDILPSKVCSTAFWTVGTVIVPGTASCPPDSQTVTWMTPLDQTFYIARAQAIIALCSTIPGYWVTVLTIEKMGRWWIQMMGFLFMTLFMGILAGLYPSLKHNVSLFIALYALTFFFANWGPNSTTFVIPAEIFPAKFRSSAHGIAAASGKAGAIIGAFGFLYASKDPSNPKDLAAYGNVGIGLQNSFFLLFAINIAGMLFTFLVPESRGKSLEELGGEMEYAKAAKGDANGEVHIGIPSTKSVEPYETNGENGTTSAKVVEY